MGRSSLPWEDIRKDYEEAGLNAAALAIKYDCKSITIYQRASTEGWKKPDEEIDPDCVESEEDIIPTEIAIYEQKRYLARLHRELDATTSKPGQMKQWIKEGTAGNIDSRRKAMYQVLSLPNRMLTLKNATACLKTIVEIEIAAGILNVGKGKKAQAERAVELLDDDRFDLEEVS